MSVSVSAVPFEEVDISPCGLITLVGVSNSGKTTLLRSVVNKLFAKGLYRIYVFSTTADIYRKTDYNFAAPRNVRNISLRQIEALVGRQKAIVVRAAGDKRLEPKWIGIVLDDFIGHDSCDLSGKDAKIMTRLAVSGRHCKTCMIILSQHLNKVPPVIRMQSNYMFVTKVTMGGLKDGIYPLQTQYENKNQLWALYKEHSKRRYSSMMMQSIDPYEDNIRWLMPAKSVMFIDDKESAEIIRDVEETQLEEFKDEDTDDSKTTDNESSF